MRPPARWPPRCCRVETRELAPRVAEASGGNPFFAEEVARADRRRRAGADADAASGHGAGRDRRRASTCSRAMRSAPFSTPRCSGQNFLGTALAELSGASAGRCPSLADREGARRRSSSRSAPDRYGFRHALIRDVAYASLPRGERARLHELAARGDRRHAPASAIPELAELIAYHCAQAAELDPGPSRGDAAYDASVEAARIAARRGATARAQELYRAGGRSRPATRPGAPRRSAPRPSWLSALAWRRVVATPETGGESLGGGGRCASTRQVRMRATVEVVGPDGRRERMPPRGRARGDDQPGPRTGCRGRHRDPCPAAPG